MTIVYIVKTGKEAEEVAQARANFYSDNYENKELMEEALEDKIIVADKAYVSDDVEVEVVKG